MTPKYRMIAEELRSRILQGKYRSDRPLPTEHAIAEEYQVSRQTVRQALSLLAESGLIERRQGSGSYLRIRSGAESAPSPLRSVAVITTYISDYIFPAILREAESVLAENGCTTVLFATCNQLSRERKILTRLLNSPVDGILAEGTRSALPNPNLDLYEQLQEKGIPLVFMNGAYAGLSGAVSVLDDNAGGGRMLVEYLHGKGHSRIAGIFKSDDIQGHLRFSGYAQALRDLGIPMEDRSVLWYSTEDRSEILDGPLSPRILRALEGCTAAVCYNDEVASHLVRLLPEQGVQIPRDLAVVSFDCSQYSELAPVRITSLSHGEQNAGGAAARLLVREMNGESCRPELLPWTLVEKESS